MMGTGNFNITLVRGAEPEHGLRHRAAAGRESGLGRLLRRRRHRHHPEGQQARRRRRRLHEVPPVGRGAGRGLRQDAEHDHARRHGRQQVLRGRAARCRTSPRRSTLAATPYTLKFFELINSPQGPWLQMLQRAYYDGHRPRHDHRRRQGADEGDRRRVIARPGRGARQRWRRGLSPRQAGERIGNVQGQKPDTVGLLYLAPALAFVLAFTAYPLVQMVWMSLHNWSLIAAKKCVGVGNFVKAWNDRSSGSRSASP